nr:Mobile element protein [Escherichia coli]
MPYPELLGWHLSPGKKTAEAALEQANCQLRQLDEYAVLLRSDNGLVFTSRNYTALVKIYGQQEFITPYTRNNGMVRRIRTLKSVCPSAEVRDLAAQSVTGSFYNQKRLHRGAKDENTGAGLCGSRLLTRRLGHYRNKTYIF